MGGDPNHLRPWMEWSSKDPPQNQQCPLKKMAFGKESFPGWWLNQSTWVKYAKVKMGKNLPPIFGGVKIPTKIIETATT